MMIPKKNVVSRRTLLRGLGCAVAVPWLESMGPMVSGAKGASTPVSKAAPNRMAFVYVPNGKNMKDWTPAAEGASFELPAILQPLKDVRNQISILTGLAADKARPHGDGGGDHARAMAAFPHWRAAAQDRRHGHSLGHLRGPSRSGAGGRSDAPCLA